MRIEVVTLFPEFVADAVRVGVLGRAVEAGRAAVNATSPREFAEDVHRTVDDRPYGGGPGMVLRIEPARTAIRAAKARLPAGSGSIYLAADGAPLTHAKAQRLAQLPGLLLLAGRYEGVDERLIETEIDESVSIGDYVLSGGELPTLVLIDAVVRLLPGVLGSEASAQQDSFVAGLLDWPHYTRPEVFEGRAVPRGAGRRQSCGDPALAGKAGAGPYVAQASGSDREDDVDCRAAAIAGRIHDGASRRRATVAGLKWMGTTMNIIEKLESEALNKKIPDFSPGDTVVVEVKVKEGDRERAQAYEGIVIARRNRGFNSSFTVRKISHGEGVERVFQTYSPSIGAITVKRRGNVRRAKLYYLRDLTGKAARIEEKV